MEKTNQVHEGRNIKRFREMLGIKQEALAFELGDDWSQKKVSQLEAKETVEADILAQVATILKVPVESIKNFDEEAAINVINATFNSHDNSTSIAYQSTFNFNPLDKLIESYEENKNLYERLLEAEKAKVAYLERLMKDK